MRLSEEICTPGDPVESGHVVDGIAIPLPADLRPVALNFHLASPGGDLLDRATTSANAVVGTFGLVGRCHRRPQFPGLPTVPIYVATGSRRDGSGRPLRSVPIGTGVSDIDGIARLQAIAEVLERYCLLSRYHQALVVRASHDQLGRWAIPVSSFGLFSDEQYRDIPSLHRPAPHEPIDWTWAYSLTRERFALVPAVLVLASLTHRPPNNFAHGLSSTGVATHVSLEAAVLSGIYEAVERDAVMLTWLHRRSPPQISLQGAPAPFLRLLDRHFDLPGIDFLLLDVTVDSGIPTVAALALSDDPTRPAAVMGSASRSDPVEAATKALFETAQILSGLAGLGCAADSALAEADVRTVDDHARFYAGAAGAARLSFLAEGEERVSFGDMASAPSSGRLGTLVQASIDWLADIGLEVLVADLTTPDVARAGFRTVKVLVPGMVDINGDVRFPLLGSQRIDTVPKAMGWPARSRHELNLAPCPLP